MSNEGSMNFPLETQQFVLECLEGIRNDPSHNLIQTNRTEVLKSFGASNYFGSYKETEEQIKNGLFHFSKADLTCGWLGVITAKKVLPIWEQSFSIKNKGKLKYWDDFPKEMLTAAENVLLEKANLYKAFCDTMYNEFYMSIGGVHYDFNEKTTWACYATYGTLSLIFLGLPAINRYGKHTEACAEALDGEIFLQCLDYAKSAMNSYCVIDKNNGGSRARLESLNKYTPLIFDLQKNWDFGSGG